MRNIVLILIIAFLASTVAAQKQDETMVDKVCPGTANPNGADLSLSGSSDKGRVSITAGTTNAVDLNNAAVRCALKGHYREAISVFRDVVSKAPNLVEPRLNLGIWLGNTNQYDEAIMVLNDLIVMKPDYANAHAALGEVLYKKGLVEESIGQLREALKLDPSNVVTLINLGQSLYEVRQYEEALSLFESAIKLSRPASSAKAYNNQGVVLLALNRPQEAVNSFQKAIAADANFASPYNNLGIALSRMQKKKEAQKSFLKAIQLRPDWGYAIYCLAVNFIELDERPPAQKLLNELDKIDNGLALKLRDKLWQGFVIKAKSN